MAHRGHWSEHEARGVLSAWRKSGQTIERFALDRGLAPQRVRWWRNKLEGKPTALARTQQGAVLPLPALGRKNYLFVGDVDAGMSIAGLYTLVATCEARGINPFAYLADVIPRVQDHPKRRLDELLPGPWARARAGA